MTPTGRGSEDSPETIRSVCGRFVADPLKQLGQAVLGPPVPFCPKNGGEGKPLLK